MKPLLPLAAGFLALLLASARLVAQTAPESPRYLFLNCSDGTGSTVEAVMEYAKERFGAINRTAPLKVGVAVIYSADSLYSPNQPSAPLREWGRDEKALLGRLNRHLELARSLAVPILIQVDIERSVSLDLVNWHDASLPGYNAENLANVEWFDWQKAAGKEADYAPKLTWRNWGAQIPVPPSPNLMSPVFRARAKALINPLIDALLSWEKSLPSDQKYLFGGWRVGWETSLNNSELYYPGTNAAYASILKNPLSTNPDIAKIVAGKFQYLGHNGLRSAGLFSETDGALTDSAGSLKPVVEDKMNRLLGMYLTEFSKYAVDRGIPRDKIFLHSLRSFPELLVNPYANPGVTGTGKASFPYTASDGSSWAGEGSVRTNDPELSGTITRAMGTTQATGFSLGEMPMTEDSDSDYTLSKNGKNVTYSQTESAYKRWMRFLESNFRPSHSLRYASIYNYESVVNQLGAERAIMEFAGSAPTRLLVNDDFVNPDGWWRSSFNNWTNTTTSPTVWTLSNGATPNPSSLRLGPEKLIDPTYTPASDRTLVEVKYTTLTQTIVEGFKAGDRFSLTFDWRQKSTSGTVRIVAQSSTGQPDTNLVEHTITADSTTLAWSSRSVVSLPLPESTRALRVEVQSSSQSVPAFVSKLRLLRVTADDVNAAPSITGLNNRVLTPAGSVPVVTTIPLTITDDRTSPKDLKLTASSNNESVAQVSISYDSATGKAQLKVTQPAGARGLAGITVTATDKETDAPKTASAWCLVEVTSNQPPLIAAIPDQYADPASLLPLAIPLTLSDPDAGDQAQLTVTAKATLKNSTDPVWSADRLSIATSGGTQTLTIRPPARSDGSSYDAFITVSVSDAKTKSTAKLSTLRTFMVRVGPASKTPPSLQWQPVGETRVKWVKPSENFKVVAQAADPENTANSNLRLIFTSISRLADSPFLNPGSTAPVFSPSTPPALSTATSSQPLRTAPVALSIGSQTGLFLVSVTADNRKSGTAGGLTTQENLLLRVAPDFPPKFSTLPTDVEVPMGSAPFITNLTLAADDTPGATLEIVGQTDNPELILKIEDITPKPIGLARQIRVTPAVDKTGTALITLIVRHPISIISLGKTESSFLQSACQFRFKVTYSPDFTWNGTATSKSVTLAANWRVTGATSSALPVGDGTETLRFLSSATTTVTQDAPTALRVKDILIDGVAGNHTFNGTAGYVLTGGLRMLGTPLSTQNPVHTFDTPLTLAGSSQLDLPVRVEWALNKPLAGSVGLRKTGAGTLRLNATAIYTGDTVIEDGSVIIGTVANAIPSASPLWLGGQGTSGMLMLGTYPNPQNLLLTRLGTRGDKGRIVGQADPAKNVFSLLTLAPPADTPMTFDGELGHSGFSSRNQLSVTKDGLGDLTLAGRSVALGPVTVKTGRLSITADWSAATGSIQVDSGATLAGTGTLGGATVIKKGGTLAFAVDSSGRPATRSVLKSVTFESASKILLEGSASPPPGIYPLLTSSVPVLTAADKPTLQTSFPTTGKNLQLNWTTNAINLEVVDIGQTFSQWLVSQGMSQPKDDANQRALFALHGGDYAFGASDSRMQSLEKKTNGATSNAVFSYKRRAKTELQFVVETASKLATPTVWTVDTSATVTVTASTPGFELVTVTLSVPWPTSGTLFVRGRASL